MAGQQQAAMTPRFRGVYQGNVTVGVSGANAGYATDFATFGSISGNLGNIGGGVTGVAVRYCSLSGTNDFMIQLAGPSLPQTHFFSVTVNDGTGANRTYLASAASFINAGDTSWSWGTGSNMVWTSGDSGEVHLLTIQR